MKRQNRVAFTLIEMIFVISVVSILLSLLYGALERSQKFSRRAIAFAELKSLEAAFKQYRAHYHQWPTNLLATVRLTSGEDNGMELNRDVADMLQGRPLADPTQAGNINPEAIPFIEFSRYFAKEPFMPVNPFKSDQQNGVDRQYYVLFDANGDHEITVPAGATWANAQETNIVAEVAVWTFIPGTRKGTGNETTSDVLLDERLESWNTFGVK